MTEETFEQVTYALATPIDCDNAIIARALFWLTCAGGGIARRWVLNMTGRRLQMSAIINRRPGER